MPRVKKQKYETLSTQNKILFLHKEMKDIVLEAGIQEPKYNFIIKKLESQTSDYHDKLLLWLEGFKDNEYKAAKHLWNQVDPQGWKNCKELLGIHNLPEQKQLRHVFRVLRWGFINWPRPEKKIKKQIIPRD